MNLKVYIELFKEYEKVYGKAGIDTESVEVVFEDDGVVIPFSHRSEHTDAIYFYTGQNKNSE